MLRRRLRFVVQRLALVRGRGAILHEEARLKTGPYEKLSDGPLWRAVLLVICESSVTMRAIGR
jgi:hypothetical protein